ncbi:MAG: TolC family protein [Gemmatimonadota bacterium]|nr:TolC family protein [Gemmatimonadota bacterium]
MRNQRITSFWKKCSLICGLVVMGLNAASQPLQAHQHVRLTLDSAVEIAMGSSYRIKQLGMGIERTRHWLKSRQASLKSHVSMSLKAPDIKALSERKWNSTLKKDQIIHENTRRWQMDLSIRQPVVLFGYPTNGYLSINNQVYRYLQRDGYDEVDYYNRYYLKFEQPFFLPNNLKNNIEEAELDLERNELSYNTDRVRLLDQIADDYYDLYEVIYKDSIYIHQTINLEKIAIIADSVAQEDTTRAIETAHVQVELANAREMLLKNNSDIRLELMRIKQRLRLDHTDSVYLEPEIKITPVTVDVDQAVQYGFSLRPRLRMLAINKRKDEIDLNNSKGWDAFHMNLEVTYGLEKQDDRFGNIWQEYDNSNSVSLSAYIPIWDWGRRKERIQANQISLRKTEMYIEESRNNIRSSITNAVRTLAEYQQRALNMQANLRMVQEISDVGMKQYRDNAISLQDLLQSIDRQKETELNFLYAYMGYRRSLLSLMTQTYYDYENDISLEDKFRGKI